MWEERNGNLKCDMICECVVVYLWYVFFLITIACGIHLELTISVSVMWNDGSYLSNGFLNEMKQFEMHVNILFKLSDRIQLHEYWNFQHVSEEIGDVIFSGRFIHHFHFGRTSICHSQAIIDKWFEMTRFVWHALGRCELLSVQFSVPI